MANPTEIGAYEAKTHLPEVLRKVQAGSRFTITQRGKPVADLVPAGASAQRETLAAANRMRAFVQNRPAVQGIDIKALIEAGRD